MQLSHEMTEALPGLITDVKAKMQVILDYSKVGPEKLNFSRPEIRTIQREDLTKLRGTFEPRREPESPQV